MIYEKIRADIIKSMKEKNSFVLNTLRMLDSDIQKKALDTNKPISDDLVLDVIVKCIKQRNESAQVYKENNRIEASEKELDEVLIMSKYQPTQLTQEEIIKIIDDAITLTGAKSIKEMGKLMKEVSPLVKGKADNKVVSEIIKGKLGV